MTDEELKAIQALADGATPGPWVQDTEVDGVYAGQRTVVLDPVSMRRIATVDQTRTHLAGERNIAFIAASRETVPKLVAALQEAHDWLASVEATRHDSIAQAVADERERLLRKIEERIAEETAKGEDPMRAIEVSVMHHAVVWGLQIAADIIQGA